MIKEVIEITDIGEFIAYLKTKFKISSYFEDDISSEIKEMKKKGQIFYEEGYRGENKVRIFNRYNLELWDYIEKNSKDKYDGTAEISFSITSLLERFDIKDTKENRIKIANDIEEICNHIDFIVADCQRSFKKLIDSYSRELNGENFTIYLPWDKQRIKNFFKHNKIVE